MARAHTKSGLPSARVIAASVVERVERDAAFAAAVLDSELSRHSQLDPRERAFATELVYGTLRARAALVVELSKYARRGLGKDKLVFAHLLVAAYQLLVLDRVPSFAAVDEAVSSITAVRGPKVGGFANAVLRKLAASSVKLSVANRADAAPDWLRRRLVDAVGAQEAENLLAAEATPAVRVVSGRELPDWLREAPPGRVAATARLVQGRGDLRKGEGYERGCYVVQEEGAQLVGLALGVRAGERVLDACAGRGQKTSLLSERAHPGGEVWAADLYPSKLSALLAEHVRLGLPPPHVAAVDWTLGSGELPNGFDRALVDAPCSGTGTLRRRPEIALRLKPDDPARLADIQHGILRRVAELVKPGGRVVYAVCSVLQEEGEGVIARVRDVLEPAEFDAPELAALTGASGPTIRLLPGAHGTDGFFMASLRRKA